MSQCCCRHVSIEEKKVFGRKRKRNRKKIKKVPLRIRAKAFALKTVKVMAAVAVLALLGLTVRTIHAELLTNEFFSIKTIEVSSMERVSRDEVLRLSKLRPGLNIFSIDTDKTVERIKRHPWIEDAVVKRSFPDKVEIVVKERVPIALVKLDELYVMDINGVVFKRFSIDDRLDLPVVTGLDPDAGSGEMEARLLELIELLDGRQGFNLKRVSEIHVDPLYGFTIYTLDEGVRLYLGTDRLEARLSAFEKVWSFRGGDLAGIESFDLTSERGVVVRFKEDFIKGFKRHNV